MEQSGNEQLRARKGAATPRGVGVVAPLIADRAHEPLCDGAHEKPVDA